MLNFQRVFQLIEGQRETKKKIFEKNVPRLKVGILAINE